MDYRVSTLEDIPGILKLQEKNLVTNLSEEEKKDGFVTTPFTAEQLEELISINGMVVIEDSNSILGYAVAAGWDYFDGRPMFDYMISRFKEIKYQKIQITYENSFQYGPVCIDISLRGTNAFPKLFSKMKEEMAKKYPIGTTFINKINIRSYKAHLKLPIDVINEFEFNGNHYYGLAFLAKSQK